MVDRKKIRRKIQNFQIQAFILTKKEQSTQIKKAASFDYVS
jgi:hypothetical protein